MNSFLKDLINVLKSRVLVIGAGIVSGVITARYIGPVGNGVIAVLITYPDIFMTIGSLGVRQSTTYYVGQEKYSDNDIFSSVLFVGVFTSVFCIIVCYTLLKFFTKETYDDRLILLAVAPIPFSLLTTYASGLFLGKNKIKEFNQVNWVPSVIRLIFIVLLVMVIPLDVYGQMIAILAGYFFLTFLVYRKVVKMVKIRLKYNREIIGGLLRLGIIYAISLLVISLNYKLDVTLLERYSSQYEVGIYTKGVSIVQYLWEIPTLLSTLIFSRSAISKKGDEFSRKVCVLLRITTVVIVIAGALFFVLSSFIMVTLYGQKFLPSAMVQKIMIPGIWLMTIFKVLNMDLAGKGKPWIAINAMLPSLVINVIFNCLLDAKYGANGSSWASTISYTISSILFLYFYSKEVKIPIKEILAFKKSDFEIFSVLFNKIKNKTARA